MASEKNNFSNTVENLFKGMDGFISSKTVVGEPMQLGDTTIVPLVDVSFGIGAGAFAKDSKNNSAGGLSGKVTPSAVLVIQNGTSKLINVKDYDGLSRILDMVPEIVNKFTKDKNVEETAE